MGNSRKEERFKKITAARAGKINDMLRLLGNCSNKNNYSYTDAEVREIFSSVENALDEAKQKYEVYRTESSSKSFRTEFEGGYTWISGFMRNVMRYSRKTALICPQTGRTWSYGDLNGEANRLANAMLRAGVKKGDKVVYQTNNRPEFAFIYIACHKLGAVGCPLNIRLSPAQTANVIDFLKPRLFFYENNGDSELALSMSAHKPLPVIIGYPRGKRPLKGHMLYESFILEISAEEPNISHSIYDTTTLFYTSGTTGHPKCVPVCSLNEVLSVHDVLMRLPITVSDRAMSLSSWTHRGGMHCMGPAVIFYSGASLVAADIFSPSLCLEYAEHFKVSFVGADPAALRLVADAQEKEDRNLSALKGVISVGSTLGREECIRYQRVLSPNIYNGYGTTETFWNTLLTPEMLTFSRGTVGLTCVDDDVRVVRLDEENTVEPWETVPQDGVTQGQIIIKSLAKSFGAYFQNAQKENGRYYKGYMYTNDIGTWDENGVVSLCGRNDDMIILGGDKIYPEEIEDFISSHEKVADCIVTSVTDADGTEKIAAYVVKADRSLTVRELNEYCLRGNILARDKCPELYRFKKVLPYTSTGKKLHKKAHRMAADDIKRNMFKSVKQDG